MEFHSTPSLAIGKNEPAGNANWENTTCTTMYLAAAFNLFATLLLLFPSSIGAFSGLPSEGPLIYRWIMALFVALFGVAYA